MANPVETSNENAAGLSVFGKVFVGLCLLTALSVVVAYVPIFPNKVTTWIVFMGIAVAKASLVVCYFMHLRWERYWKYFLTIPALILGVALGLSLLPDVGMRSHYYSKDRIESGPQDISRGAGGNDEKHDNEPK